MTCTRRGSTFWLLHHGFWVAFLEPAHVSVDNGNSSASKFACDSDDAPVLPLYSGLHHSPPGDVVTMKDGSGQDFLHWPVEHRGYKIYRALKFVYEKDPVSGHEWKKPVDAKGFRLECDHRPLTETTFHTLSETLSEIKFLEKFGNSLKPGKIKP